MVRHYHQQFVDDTRRKEIWFEHTVNLQRGMKGWRCFLSRRTEHLFSSQRNIKHSEAGSIGQQTALKQFWGFIAAIKYISIQTLNPYALCSLYSPRLEIRLMTYFSNLLFHLFQSFSDFLLQLNWKWANIFNEISKYHSLNNCKYGFVKLLHSLLFNTSSELFIMVVLPWEGYVRKVSPVNFLQLFNFRFPFFLFFFYRRGRIRKISECLAPASQNNHCCFVFILC